jgi:HAMP domain-containing protein
MIRNLPIRTKLFAILIAPLIALTILASVGIGTSLARKVEAEHLADEAAVTIRLSQLVDELQQERDLSAGWVAGNGSVEKSGVVAQRKVVDKALASFRNSVQGLGVHESPFHDRLALILPELSKLDEGRQQIVDSPDATASATLEHYSGIIDDLLAVNHEVAGETGDQALIGHVAAFSSLAQLKEATSLERGVSNAAAAAGRFGPGELEALERIAGAQRAWRNQFNAVASPEQREALNRALQGTVVGQGTLSLDSVLVSGPQTQVDLDPAQRYRDAGSRVTRLRQVEQRVAADLSAGSRNAQEVANRQALIYTLILTLVLWLTVGLSFLMASSMVRPLQVLTRTANDVADKRLPGVVDQLQHIQDPRDLDVTPEPVPVKSRDEIGQVSAAFNSVHRVAIKVATEQAALRRSIRDMFINLARRSQNLIDRQLELLEDLERNETNSETLEHLFRLDHLATRMRRNAEDLIVLSGTEPGRHWVEPMTVTDVARAAAAEVEEYQRVEFLPMIDVDVAGHVAVDVIHLLAELIENATAFSPPTTKVQIAGQVVPHGYVLEIEDRGLGMSDDELIEANERLTNPPEIDFALSRVLGLYVVGQLSQRHGIKVQLRHSWYGGVTALALLPHDLLVWPKEPQAIPEPAAAVSAGRAELPPPERRGGNHAAPEATPAPSRDHLPIFEAARSDWFVTEPEEPTSLPHRQRQHQRAAGDGEVVTDGGGTARPGHPAGRSGPRLTPSAEEPRPFRPPPSVDEPRPFRPPPAPERVADAPPPIPEGPPLYPPEPAPTHRGIPSGLPGPTRAADDDAPLYRAERARLHDDTPVSPSPPTEQPRSYEPAPVAEAPPPPAAAAPATGQGERVTGAGLPRRVPRANLAPGMVASQQTGPQPPLGEAASRSPEEVRSMLSSYRTGIERGRTVAGGADRDDRQPENP